MIRHLVMWNCKEGFSQEENRDNLLKIKNGLEGLKGKIDEIAGLDVYIDLMSGSTFDIFLDSRFKSKEDMDVYAKHPLHQKEVSFINSVLTGRKCVDLEF